MTRLKKVQQDFLIALGLAMAAAAAAALLNYAFGVTRISAIFLAPVAVAGTTRGKQAGLIAALLSVIFYRLFLEYAVAEPSSVVEDLLNATVFLFIAVLTGALAGRVRDVATRARVRAERMEQLFDVSRKVNTATEPATLWPLLSQSVSQLVRTPAVALVDATGTSKAERGENCEEGVQRARAILSTKLSGSGESEGWTVRRIEDGGRLLGAAAWLNQARNEEDKRQVEESADLVLQMGAAALSRQYSSEMKLQMESIEATARLREALLSSISHDFRSPLAAIMGSSSSLLEYGNQFSGEVRHDLLLNIQDEAERLNDYVENLLKMSRLQAGVLDVQRERICVKEAVEAVQARLSRHRNLAVDIRIVGTCNVYADRLLLEQALYNILDNAMRHGNGEKGITVTCNLLGPGCLVSVADAGPGLSEEDHSAAFADFHLGRAGKAKGTGLGLSIVRGFVEAMGGTVSTAQRTDGCTGLVVMIQLQRV